MAHLRCWRRRGYTLLELVAALTLLGILAGLAAPAAGAYLRSLRMQVVLDTLGRDIFQARMVAVRSGGRVEIRFHPADAECVQEYRVVAVGPPEREIKAVEVAAAARGMCLRRSGSPTVEISSRGRPNWGYSFWIRDGGTLDSLTLNQLGRVNRWR